MRPYLPLVVFATITTNSANADVKRITTYVVETQEERNSTRFTLTEWLRIKERMKLMDVWLAMFSDPNGRDKVFKPELSLNYFLRSATLERSGESSVAASVETPGVATRGYMGSGQLWLTNMISASTGVKTLNVDLGFEGGQSNSGSYREASEPNEARFNRTTWYTANLRLLGRHIQDTSLVLKYGLYQGDHSVLLDQYDQTRDKDNGTVAGAEMNLYILQSLGVEGLGHLYQSRQTAYDDHSVTGSYWHANAFVEIAMLRLMWGMYEERWNADGDTSQTQSRERGYQAGLKLQL